MEQNEEIRKAIQSVEKSNVTDWAALLTQGGIGAVPVVGGIIGEVINEFIPNQRQDRIVKLIVLLSEKLHEQDIEIVRLKLHDPYHIDMFEDACFQAIRALSDERLNYIANALKNSITNDQLEITHRKTLLWLLGQINDIEVILLFFYQKLSEGIQKEYAEKHKDVIYVPPVAIGSTPEEYQRAAIHDSYKDHLVQLGLLGERYPFLRDGETPKFDAIHGKFKGGHLEITPLGRSLCDYITDEVEDEVN